MIITAIVCVCLTGIAMFEDDGMLRCSFWVCCSTVPGLRVLFLLSAQCSVCMFCLHTGWVVPFDWFFVCQHTPWCMSLADHSLTPDLTIFQLMWTAAPWNHFCNVTDGNAFIVHLNIEILTCCFGS